MQAFVKTKKPTRAVSRSGFHHPAGSSMRPEPRDRNGPVTDPGRPVHVRARDTAAQAVTHREPPQTHGGRQDAGGGH
mgnify:CR=1 FL=1